MRGDFGAGAGGELTLGNEAGPGKGAGGGLGGFTDVEQEVGTGDGVRFFVGLGGRGSEGGAGGRGVAGGVEAGEGRGGAAEWAGGVGGEAQGAGGGGEGVVLPEAAEEGFADLGEEFEGFEGLQSADLAAERADHAGFAAAGHETGGGRFGVEAAVTGTAEVGGEDGDLALSLVNAAVDEGHAREHGGIVGEVAGGEVVRAIDYHIVGGDEDGGVFRGEAFGVGDEAHLGVEGGQAGGGAGEFGRGGGGGGGVVQDLALQVVEGDGVEIGQAQRADPGGGEVEGDGTAESAETDDEHATGGESGLAGGAELGQTGLAGVTGHGLELLS